MLLGGFKITKVDFGLWVHEVANMAEWEDEQIEYIKEKVTEEGKEADLKKGSNLLRLNWMKLLSCWI